MVDNCTTQFEGQVTLRQSYSSIQEQQMQKGVPDWLLYGSMLLSLFFSWCLRDYGRRCRVGDECFFMFFSNGFQSAALCVRSALS